MNLLKKTVIFIFMNFVFTLYGQEIIRIIPDDELSINETNVKFINNLMQSEIILNSKYIEVANPFEYQSHGKLNFFIDGLTEKELIFRVSDISYKNNNFFKWSGDSFDKTKHFTILRDENGYSGFFYDYSEDRYFRILPIQNNQAQIIEYNPNKENPTTCELEIKKPSNGIFCDEVCPSHIDILFLLTPDAENWLVAKNNSITYLNLLMAELSLVWSNSNIPHTTSYNYDYLDFNPTYDGCEEDAEELASNTQAKQLREQYSADIVVLLTSPNSIWNNSTACVAEVGPVNEDAFILLPISEALREYVFVHEIGHIFGAQHLDQRPASNSTSSDFAFAHRLLLPTGFKYTVLGGSDSRIPHHSDPDIYYFGESTGYTDPNGGDDHNNAGRIRETGCRVGEFNESSSVNAIIATNTINDCTVEFQAMVNPTNDNYKYSWSWNYEGIFSSQFPSNFLGSGASMSISYNNQPDGNPCNSYFIQLEVTLNGQVVSSQVVTQEGGICVDNVDCNTSSSSKTTNTSHFIKPKINIEKKQDHLQNIKYTFYLVDIYGRIVDQFDDNPIIDSKPSLKEYKGIFFILMKGNDGSFSAQKIILN